MAPASLVDGQSLGWLADRATDQRASTVTDWAPPYRYVFICIERIGPAFGRGECRWFRPSAAFVERRQRHATVVLYAMNTLQLGCIRGAEMTLRRCRGWKIHKCLGQRECVNGVGGDKTSNVAPCRARHTGFCAFRSESVSGLCRHDSSPYARGGAAFMNGHRIEIQPTDRPTHTHTHTLNVHRISVNATGCVPSSAHFSSFSRTLPFYHLFTLVNPLVVSKHGKKEK